MTPAPRKQITWVGKDDSLKRRNDARIRTVVFRLDPATNKKARSFLHAGGTVKFINRPCELCEKIGKKNQWHFNFECPAKEKITSLIAEIDELDTDPETSDIENIPGVSSANFTQALTSYVFSNASNQVGKA